MKGLSMERKSKVYLKTCKEVGREGEGKEERGRETLAW